MASFTSVNGIEQAGTALEDFSESTQTIADLRAVPETARFDQQVRLVEDAEALYRFDFGGVGADDGNLIVKPNDVAAFDPGRWFKIAPATSPLPHAASHENGGPDEIDVTGLSGTLGDPQVPTTHAASHQHGGADEVATAVPGANAISKAAASGKLANGWLNTGPGNGLDADTVDGMHAAAFEAAGAAAAAVTAHETAFAHANLPTAGEKAALPGTSGAPGAGNKYVTDGDARNTDARTPTVHAASHKGGGTDVIDGATAVLAGLMSAVDKTKSDTVLTNAADRERHQFGRSAGVPVGGTLQLQGPGTTLVGVRANRAGTITGGSLQVDVVDATRTYKLSIRVGGVEVALIVLPVSTLGVHSIALAVAFVAGAVITSFVVRTAGAGASTFGDQHAMVELTY